MNVTQNNILRLYKVTRFKKKFMFNTNSLLSMSPDYNLFQCHRYYKWHLFFFVQLLLFQCKCSNEIKKKKRIIKNKHGLSIIKYYKINYFSLLRLVENIRMKVFIRLHIYLNEFVICDMEFVFHKKKNTICESISSSTNI